MQKRVNPHSDEKMPRKAQDWFKTSSTFNHSRKGYIFALFNPIAIAIVAIAAVLLLGIFVGFAVFLTFNVFTLLGITLALLSAVALFNGHYNNYVLGMGAVGLLMLVIPIYLDSAKGITLAAIGVG